MSVFKYEKDDIGIVTVTMDMTGPVNTMNAEGREALASTVERLESEQGLRGVVFTSAKKAFFAGADLAEVQAIQKGHEAEFMAVLTGVKDSLRRLEKLPVPVVAAINGTALGGGFELCLACNYRIAVDSKSIQIGLPEVSLGLIPGAGGVVRLVKMLGLEKALPFLLEGKKLRPAKAQQKGLINETVEHSAELLPRAKTWIKANIESKVAAVQPWYKTNYRIPGGSVASPQLSKLMMMAPVMLRQKTRGLMPAPEAILNCAVEAARLDLDTASIIESRHLVYLATTVQAKNMINTFFFQMNQVNAGASRPTAVEASTGKKVGILGAGMMGQGIAYVSAMAGISVVLKDVDIARAKEGKAYAENLLTKREKRKRITPEKKAAVLNLIKPTANDEDLDGCDLIIEAVFEDIEIKNKITASTEQHLVDQGVWASNTSTLPISQLAEASSKPEQFIGMHFFSPVDKMPLVEIICGEKTNDETLAKAFDYVRQIKKTPIVVNDSLGFYTTRVFGSYLDEGVRLLKDGVHPVQIDALGKALGMAVGPLTSHDEVSLELSHKVSQTHKAMGVLDKHGDGSIMREVVQTLLLEFGRGGRHYNGGFYDYGTDEKGNEIQKVIWPKLLEIYHDPALDMVEQDIKDRLLFRQVIMTLNCLQENVLRTVADGNLGSIMAFGAPLWTGGLIQFVNTYGPQKFVDRCRELATQYGDRFNPPENVVVKAENGECFE